MTPKRQTVKVAKAVSEKRAKNRKWRRCWWTWPFGHRRPNGEFHCIYCGCPGVDSYW